MKVCFNQFQGEKRREINKACRRWVPKSGTRLWHRRTIWIQHEWLTHQSWPCVAHKDPHAHHPIFTLHAEYSVVNMKLSRPSLHTRIRSGTQPDEWGPVASSISSLNYLPHLSEPAQGSSCSSHSSFQATLLFFCELRKRLVSSTLRSFSLHPTEKSFLLNSHCSYSS